MLERSLTEAGIKKLQLWKLKHSSRLWTRKMSERIHVICDDYIHLKYITTQLSLYASRLKEGRVWKDFITIADGVMGTNCTNVTMFATSSWYKVKQSQNFSLLLFGFMSAILKKLQLIANVSLKHMVNLRDFDRLTSYFEI